MDKLVASRNAVPKAHGVAQAYSTDADVYRRIPPAATPLPEKEASFRIHLSSGDAIAGSTPTNAVFNVSLQNLLRANKVKVVVESFTVNNASGGALNNVWYRVHLPELVNRSSYSSKTGGFSDLLFSTTGYQYYPRAQSGTLVPSSQFFSNRTLTVSIESPCFTYYGYTWNSADFWDLVLAVIPV